MEGDVQFQIVQSSVQLSRRAFEDPKEYWLFSDELRHRYTVYRLPQPIVAPDLADRVHRYDGCLVVPLLSSRRASGDFRPYNR